MSLEVALEANTKALLALAAALATGRTDAPKAATPPPPAQPSAKPPVQPQAQQPQTGALTYDKDIKPLALKAVAKDKPGYVALLKEFGVEGGPALKADQLASFHAKLKALLGV